MTSDPPVADPTPDRPQRMTPVRDGRGRYLRTSASEARDIQAMRLRDQGRTWRHIAETLGYAHASDALKAVHALRASVVEPAVAQHRAEMLAQLDELTARAVAILDATHLLVQRGEVVTGPDGEPMRDSGPVLRALAEVRALIGARADLVGAKAPVKVAAASVGLAELAAAMEEYEAEVRLSAGVAFPDLLGG
ncbi:MAG: hypothetical protein ACRCZP_20085 [Phycicoccus sp.]